MVGFIILTILLVLSIALNVFSWWLLKRKDILITKLKETADNCFEIINQLHKENNFAIVDKEEQGNES